MKKKFFLSLISFLGMVLFSQAQEEVRFTGGDVNIPAAETNSTSSIAAFITSNYKTGKDRLAAIYSWVTSNIRYDTDSMYAINSGGDPEARITVALKRRRGVCENFAAIFNDIAVKCSIRSYEVNGYTKQYGSIDRTAHTWCVVNLDKEWLCCDPTWDIGFTHNTNYFLADPSAFIESHMPFDPLWQLLDHRVSHKEFNSGNVHFKKDKAYVNFADSIDAYSRMSELQQLESSVSRIQEAGVVNDLIKTWVSYLQMEISMIYQDKGMNTYNAAVSDFNNANSILNNFIGYRNDRFIPVKPDKEISTLLSPIDNLILSANKKLDELDKSAVNFQYNTGSLRARLDNLDNKLREQKLFVKHYLETPLAERVKLFYK